MDEFLVVALFIIIARNGREKENRLWMKIIMATFWKMTE